MASSGFVNPRKWRVNHWREAWWCTAWTIEPLRQHRSNSDHYDNHPRLTSSHHSNLSLVQKELRACIEAQQLHSKGPKDAVLQSHYTLHHLELTQADNGQRYCAASQRKDSNRHRFILCYAKRDWPCRNRLCLPNSTQSRVIRTH